MHTHSPSATAWAQARREIPCLGTTHADHFHGSVPVTRALTAEEIDGDYEGRTGEVIVETIERLRLDPLEMPAVLVPSHGPFAWGATRPQAVENAIALEAVAPMALARSCSRRARSRSAPDLLERHFLRKHGPGAYYGQAVKALRLHGPGDLRLHEEPAPEPGEDEVLLRVTAVGLCGSDRHWFAEGGIGDAVLTRPLVLGHEFAAHRRVRSRARASGSPSTRRSRAGAAPLPRGRREPLPRPSGSPGTARPTARCAADDLARAAPPPAPRLALGRRGALLEPLGVALHALELGRVGPGTTAGVFGCGPLGLLLVQVLRLAGADVAVATDPLPHRADAARALGATRALGQASADPAGRRRASTSPSRSPATTTRSRLRSTRCGRAAASCSSGIPTGDRTSFTASTARRKGLTMLLCRRMQPADLRARSRSPSRRASSSRRSSPTGFRSPTAATRSRRSASGAASRSSSSRSGRAGVSMSYAIGVDFGTESGRAVLVDCGDGRELGTAVYPYRERRHRRAAAGARTATSRLEPDWALQDPEDYLRTFQETVPPCSPRRASTRPT